jgi:hypothetical protein
MYTTQKRTKWTKQNKKYNMLTKNIIIIIVIIMNKMVVTVASINRSIEIRM